MSTLQLFAHNIFSPAILFFALGVLAGFIKSDLDVPESISRYLSIYLMIAIGFHSGAVISETPEITREMVLTIAAGLGIGFLQPFIGYALLKFSTKLDSPTAAAVAAHYGSVSVVTFMTAMTFLDSNNVKYAVYIVSILALMEAPAILSGLFIAHRSVPETAKNMDKISPVLMRDIFTNGSILLLFGTFFIGLVTGKSGLDKMEGFLVTPFQGILALFLLDMGLMVSRELHHLKEFNLRLVLFGIYMPIIGATIGISVSYLIGLDVGTAMLFTILCASASYIAVPAAMRIALPQAKAAIYIPMSLAITFPFNIVFGIPLYYEVVRFFLR